MNQTNKKKKRRYITLIEMMIVMFLIAMITGVVAYNYQGGLEKGKIFKTEQGIEKVKMVLTLKVAEEPNALSDLESNWIEYLKESPLVSNANSLSKDGWGEEYQVRVDDSSGRPEIIVESRRLNELKQNQ